MSKQKLLPKMQLTFKELQQTFAAKNFSELASAEFKSVAASFAIDFDTFLNKY